MTQLQLLTDWANDAAPVAFWVCALWPALVAWFWPWWQHQWGWNMVIKTELIAVALLASVLRREFGVENMYVLGWTIVAAVTLIPVVIVWRTVLIWRTQRAGALDDLRLRKRPVIVIASAGAAAGVAAGWLLGYMHGQMTARWVWRYARRWKSGPDFQRNAANVGTTLPGCDRRLPWKRQ